jgi:hypothetical protein
VPYPAPYEEPWGRLAGDLRSVVASARLKLRELWRRNREGDLSVPGFWPVSLVPLFWPLLLALGLAVLLVLIQRLAPSLQPAASRVQQPVQHLVQQPVEQPVPQPVRQPVRQPVSHPVSQPVSQPVQQAGQQRELNPLQPPSPHQTPPEPLLALDPLLTLLTEDDPQACIASARPDPQASRLDLEMAAAYPALPPERRQQLADHWLQRSQELGYERLRLLDASGKVMGQAARVGSGMVLLEPSPSPQA